MGATPADPRARLRWRTRTQRSPTSRNGIYGEMWAAALVACAFTASSARGRGRRVAGARPAAIAPARGAATTCMTCMPDGADLGGRPRRASSSAYGHYSWVHTINNAALIAAGLLWGEDDYAATVGLTVQGGWDTDSNGATAGSVAGVVLGARALPENFIEPLHDRTRSALFGFDNSRISDLRPAPCGSHATGWLDARASPELTVMDVVRSRPEHRPEVEDFLRDHDSLRVARRGVLVHPLDHPALLASSDGILLGLATYVVDGDSCELLTLHCATRRAGVGTALLTTVQHVARAADCRRLWVVTTNDNVEALRFYQRRGLRLALLRAGAVDRSREHLKPEIPKVGAHGIPLRDELELEMTLTRS